MKVIANDPSIPDSYHLDNFNDLFSSLVTLFTLMVVNNWMVQVHMYVEIMDGNKYYRWFFVMFFYLSVVIGINIVVAFAIDMYTSVERLDNDRTDTLKLLEEELRPKKAIEVKKEREF